MRGAVFRAKLVRRGESRRVPPAITSAGLDPHEAGEAARTFVRILLTLVVRGYGYAIRSV